MSIVTWNNCIRIINIYCIINIFIVFYKIYKNIIYKLIFFPNKQHTYIDNKPIPLKQTIYEEISKLARRTVLS